jgi:methionine synthase II (cobalamin-independent)
MLSHSYLLQGTKVTNEPLLDESLNHAVRNIPPDRLRLHLCWGNYEGPHHHDIPLSNIIDEVLQARPVGVSFEGANPRHEHEWKVFEEVKLQTITAAVSLRIPSAMRSPSFALYGLRRTSAG